MLVERKGEGVTVNRTIPGDRRIWSLSRFPNSKKTSSGSIVRLSRYEDFILINQSFSLQAYLLNANQRSPDPNVASKLQNFGEFYEGNLAKEIKCMSSKEFLWEFRDRMNTWTTAGKYYIDLLLRGIFYGNELKEMMEKSKGMK
jgi:hypothetical protein